MALLNNTAVVIDENKRGILYGLYSTAFIGLAIALRSVRPFKKFTTPQSLPASFIKKHVTLHGRVMSVEPSGVLRVEHFPIWSLPRPDPSLLPVKIDSIQPMGFSTEWLQTVVQGGKIKFQPIKIEDNALSCIVQRQTKNIGLELVSLGFATVNPIHICRQDSKLYLKYYKNLLAAEDKAERKRLGIWAEGQRSQSWWDKLKPRSLLP